VSISIYRRRTSGDTVNATSAATFASNRAFRILVITTLVALFGLVTLGAVVRATDSGLGCPDWPLCNGEQEASTYIELSHRMVAGVTGLLVASVALVAWRHHRRQPWVYLPAALAFLLMLMQAGLGGITVLTELPRWSVMSHLAMAQALIAVLLVVYVASSIPSPQWTTGGLASRAFAPLVVATAVGAFALVMAGSYVANTTGATYICGDSWPLCRGQLLPHDELSLIHMGHRLGAVVLGLMVIAVVVVAWRLRTAQPQIWAIACIVGALFLAQVIAGGAHMWFDFASPVKVIHLSIATALWIGLALLALLSLSGRGSIAFWPEEGGAAAGGLAKRRTFPDLRAMAADHVALTKPPIVMLLLVTALGGLFMAAEGLPPLGTTLWVLFGGTLAAGGANSINHALERDVDSLMRRTSRRPVADNRVTPQAAFGQGLVLNVVAFALLSINVNLLTALLTLSATLFYVLVYTSWLKRTSTQNIVIGGAAGAVPPLAGWAAVTGGLDLPAIYLFAIVFFWTPPHFWALSLLLKDDYARAGIPMLPVVRGVPETVRTIMLYSLLLVALTVVFYVLPEVGLVYLLFALPLGGLLLMFAWRLFRSAGSQGSKPLYLFSLAYLALLFVGVMLDSSVSL